MKSIFALFLILLHLTLHAHSNGTVTGQVLDTDGEALPFETVRLLNGADSSMVTAAFSDEEGGFVLEPVAEGLYRVQVSYTSMQPFVSEAFRVKNGETKAVEAIVLGAGGMSMWTWAIHCSAIPASTARFPATSAMTRSTFSAPSAKPRARSTATASTTRRM